MTVLKRSLSGGKIEAARKRKNLSQAKLGELVGVSRASVSLYETGAGSPSYKVLTKLSEVLELPFGDLAGLGDGGDDYPGASITRYINAEMNELRSGLIKQHLGRTMTYIEVPFYGEPTYLVDIGISASTTYVSDKHAQWPTISVLEVVGTDYSTACVVTLQDNTMRPRYPSESQHVFHPITEKNRWPYLTGLYGLLIEGNPIVIRRIVANKGTSIVLTDADNNELTVRLRDVLMVWRVGQTIHLAPES